MRWPAILVLFIAIPTLAASPTVDLGGGAIKSKLQTRRVFISFNAGDSGDTVAIPNVCTHWWGNFNSSGNASMSIHGVSTLGESPSPGNLLATLSNDNRDVGPAAITKPFLKAHIVDSTAEGHLQLFCFQAGTYLRPWPVTDTPPPCFDQLAGAVYYDISLRALCACVDDGSPAWEAIDNGVLDTPTALSCG